MDISSSRRSREDERDDAQGMMMIAGQVQVKSPENDERSAKQPSDLEEAAEHLGMASLAWRS